MDHALYEELREAGASIYIQKFETANAGSYAGLEAPRTLEQRLAAVRWLADSGWFVSSGFICGLPGEGPADWLAALELAGALPLHGCSVSPFVPGETTPLAGAAQADIERTLNCMASLRLLRPDWVIPAVSALNICQPGLGYRRGLRTGANLATINLTPPDLRGDYVLYKRDRFIMDEERILGAIEAEGLQPSRTGLARHWQERAARPAPALQSA